MPLLLIIAGVIGGIVGFGVIGLFIGPVILAVTYASIGAWIADKRAAPRSEKHRRCTPRFSVALAALLTGCVVTSPAPDKQTIDVPSRSAPGETVEGLVRIPSKQVDAVYVARGATLAPYRRVMLDAVEIAFKADWQKRHPEVEADDITRFRSQGSAVFYEIFSAALSMNDGYPLTTQPGPDVLRVSASITELDVATTPGTGGNQRGYVVSPGDMTLIMDLRDSLDWRDSRARHRSREGPHLRKPAGRRCGIEFERGATRTRNVGRPAASRARRCPQRSRARTLNCQFNCR